MVMKGDAKAESLQQANPVGCRTVANFTRLMATMTVNIIPNYAYCHQRQIL